MAVDRRRGRRDNGLDAATWTAIDDLDPRVGEYLLDLLGTRGIAAYLQPSMDVNPVTRQAIVPDRPTDRLYVDQTQTEAARSCVRQVLDEAEHPSDLDATFAGIVAEFDRPDPTAPPWPAAENIESQETRPEARPAAESEANWPAAEPTKGQGTPEPAAEPPSQAGERPPGPGPADARHMTEPSLLDALDTFGAALPDRPEGTQDRFVPPPPPPLPRLSRQAVLGALAIVAGLVLLLGPDLVPFDRSTAMLLGFATILGGATALILRLRPGSDPDDTTPNDGAHV